MRISTASIFSSVSLVALATPALAQTAPAAPVETTPQKTQEDQTKPTTPTNAQGQPATAPGTIVITGSRIRRSTFTTPSPVTILTRNDTVLAGSRSTAEVLQSSTITSGTAQINGSFLGFVSEGGPAASTVGLRGLGSSRTLVLLNGRRLAPAGVGPQLIAADLNTLPTSVVQRVEVLREGASSVYGSDAIAGVVNIITDNSVNGITIDGFANHPLYGVGDNLRGSITAGKTFDRGHILASFEYRDQEGVRVGDRPDFSCPTEGFTKNGQPVGSIDPATGQVSCFGYALGVGPGIASGYGIADSFSGAPHSRFTYTDLLDPATLRAVNGLTRVSPNPMQLQDHVISPVRTYTGYLNGSYELGALGDAELYGEALFTKRQSHQDFTPQLSIDVNQLKGAQIYGGSYYGTPLQAYGIPVSPFFPNLLLQNGYNRFTPFIIPDRESQTSQTVNYLRANGGLRGHLPFGDWRYDANLQYARTRSSYSVTGTPVSNLTNALIVYTDANGNPLPAPAGTPAQYITTALPGQAGAGIGYTCASNVTNGAYNGGTCVPLNLYDPNIMIGGHMPQNVYDYIYQKQTGHSDFDQWTFEANADGTIADLQGGALKGAFGFVHREDKIVDTPSPLAQARELYNYSSSGITKGKDIVNEAYGELDAPFLRDQKFANLLELDLSGRYTDYRSVGSKFTYHLNAQWAPVHEVRFRANYGTNFRAPNLYELFVNGISGFFGSGADPCDQFGNRTNPQSVKYQNCLAALTPILGAAGALNFHSTAGPEVFTVGNASTLKPETAKTYGAGVVLTAPRHIADLTFAADYWHIKLKGEVTTLGTIILDRCYEASDFPNNQYCDLIAPRLPAGNPQQGNLSSFQNPFFNISQQTVSGIDFDVRYATPVFGGRFIAELQATRNLHMIFQQFSTDEPFDYVGTLGVQGFPAGPKWVGNLDLRYSVNDLTFRWGINYVGRQSSDKLVGQFDNCYSFGLGCVKGDLTANTYMTHGASVQWNWRDVGQFTIGVNNIFNRKPPTISTYGSSAGQYPRIGNYFNSSAYDFFGRSLFVNITHTFKPF